jgi:hypothetical protein
MFFVFLEPGWGGGVVYKLWGDGQAHP